GWTARPRTGRLPQDGDDLGLEERATGPNLGLERMARRPTMLVREHLQPLGVDSGQIRPVLGEHRQPNDVVRAPSGYLHEGPDVLEHVGRLLLGALRHLVRRGVVAGDAR